jgi:hypothetical protein
VPHEENLPAGDEPADDEVARLRSEVSALRAELGRQRRRGSARVTVRRTAAAVLVALSALAFVASVVGLWAATTVLNTNRWVSTVAPLPKQPAVASAVTQYTTTEVFQLVNLDQRLRDVLPKQADFVVGPITGQVRAYIQKTVDTAIRSDRFHAIWVEANRRAHKQALAILEGRSELASAEADHVNIDLLPVINQVLRDLSAQLPTLFGRKVSLPDLTSGAIPPNLRATVERAFGVTLPANFAQFTVYDAGRLRALQDALVTFKRTVVLLAVATVVLLALALWASPRRRRTALQLGIWLVIAAIAVIAILRALRAQLVAQVPAGTYRDGVSAAITTVVAVLRQRGTQVIWLGVLIAAVCYLCGPGRFPTWLRRTVASWARAASRAVSRASQRVGERGPSWVARYADPIRVVGVVVAVVAALVLSSWTALLVLIGLLVLFEVGVTVVARTQHAVPAE